MTLLEVTSELSGGRARVTLQGELDRVTVGEAEAALAELERGANPTTVIIDLRALRFMDSTGLHFVLGADTRARERGHRLLVVRGPEAVDRVFRLAALDGRLTFVDDPDEDPGERGRPVPEIELRLPAALESIPLARGAVDRLAGEVDEEQLDALRLLVSEMVSNSVRHGAGTRYVEVRISLGRRWIRLEVEDRGPGFRRPRAAPRASGGWGLVIVDRLATRWGVRSGPKTTVWLDLDRYAETA